MQGGLREGALGTEQIIQPVPGRRQRQTESHAQAWPDPAQLLDQALAKCLPGTYCVPGAGGGSRYEGDVSRGPRDRTQETIPTSFKIRV